MAKNRIPVVGRDVEDIEKSNEPTNLGWMYRFESVIMALDAINRGRSENSEYSGVVPDEWGKRLIIRCRNVI